MNRTLTALLPLLLLCFGPHHPGLAADTPDLRIADFEGKDYGQWHVTGDAFGPGPARGTLPNQMHVDGYLGQGLVNSFFNGDGATGTLTSPPFTLQRKYLQFLIGGGQHPGRACVNLRVAGQVVRTETGPNDRPGGSEHLDWAQWDVGEFAGQTAILEIVDQATGGWGHINLDHIVQTDRRRPGLRRDVTREFHVGQRYLNLPVRTGAPKRRVSLSVDGQTVREFEIELADGEPGFWVFLDLSPFLGKVATLKVDKLPEDSGVLEAIEQAGRIRGAEDLYRERLRPQFHFSSRRGWNNDPNGLVFLGGEYHLFYQHNPYGWAWGNMHWGHAVSADLVHWRELAIAIYPHRFGDWAFSGSAVVDARNTSGFQTGAEPVLVAAYTSTGRGECIVFSNDRGRTWLEYAGNPVVRHEGRDPRLLWHAATRRWVMAVYDEAEGKRWIAFYKSPDLKAWTFASRIEGFFECPDLFELPLDGNPQVRKWVLTAASSEYRLGQFDGRTFTPETPMLPGHRGNAFYAAQTFSDVPPRDGRRIQIGWGQMATPGMPFNQMMCFPCALALRTTPDGPRLAFEPVREIETLRARTRRWQNRPLAPGENPLAGFEAELLELRAEFTPGTASRIVFHLRGVPVTYDVPRRELSCGNRKNPLPPIQGRIRVRILVDRTSFEIFGNDGLLYMPMSVQAAADEHALALSASGGTAELAMLEVHELKSAWK
ncbi:MAG: GH32 C-terminal domain-containing protein [Verrucomicrobia bacterium]|nr:GH32 C-terminal domain-containing protein [Verrucomicrobiota bacterium]